MFTCCLILLYLLLEQNGCSTTATGLRLLPAGVTAALLVLGPAGIGPLTCVSPEHNLGPRSLRHLDANAHTGEPLRPQSPGSGRRALLESTGTHAHPRRKAPHLGLSVQPQPAAKHRGTIQPLREILVLRMFLPSSSFHNLDIRGSFLSLFRGN